MSEEQRLREGLEMMVGMLTPMFTELGRQVYTADTVLGVAECALDWGRAVLAGPEATAAHIQRLAEERGEVGEA